MRIIFARLKRKHDALHVNLVFLTPFGEPTWAVWVYLFTPFDKQRELARSRWKWLAILKALRAPVGEGRR